ncbi:ABC transporter ATP-binding protein [Thermopirellula anaerolimosa]
MSGDSPVLRVERLSLSLSGKEILRDISFALHQGEYVCLVGANGSGKTTLLRCLIGYYASYSGNVWWWGRPGRTFSQKHLARRVAYVPQGEGRSAPFTVAEFVMMSRYPHWSPFTSPRPEDRQAVARALDMTDASHLAARVVASLSGGERQRVCLAAALAQEADVLLLDEPTTFLDYRHQEDLRRLLTRFNRECGVTILAVTHDLNAAVLSGKRVMALRDGATAFQGTPDELMRSDVLERIYAAKLVLTPHPTAELPMVVPSVPEELS